MSKAHFSIDIDGHNLHARHYAAMTKEEAIERLVADGLAKDKKWAEKAHDECLKAVKEKDKK